MGNLNIQVKYLVDMPPLEFVGGKSDWIDLRTAEEVTIDHMCSKLIPLGIAMKLPPGYEAHLLPRSSTWGRYGIIMANSMGVIDETYCGDNDQWMFNAIALGNKVTIPAGARICQFRIVTKMAANDTINFETVDHLSDTDRGGFGSTGSV